MTTMTTKTETNDTAAVVGAQSAAVAPEKAATKKGAKKKPARRGAKGTAAKKAAGKSKVVRTGGKADQILGLIGRPKGATLVEIMKATEWQAHSVRGFISTAAKKGAKIESSKNEAGERVYRAIG